MTIEQLQVVISAQTQQFEKSMEGVKKSTNKVEKEIASLSNKATKAFKGIGVAVAAAFSVKAIVGFTKEVVNLADNIDKLSQRTGIATGSLQALNYAADLSGVSVDTFSKAVNKLSQEMYDINNADLFKKLGVDIVDSSGKAQDAGKVFYQTLLQISRIENATEQAVVGNKLFGRSFVELRPLLQNNGEDLKKMAAQSEKLGLIMNEDLIRASVNLNDSLTTLRYVWRAAFFPIQAYVIPMIETVVVYLTALGRLIGEFFTKLTGYKPGTSGLEDLEKNALGIGDGLESAGSAATKLKKQLQGFDELNVIPEQTSSGGAGGSFGLLEDFVPPLIKMPEFDEDSIQAAMEKLKKWLKIGFTAIAVLIPTWLLGGFIVDIVKLGAVEAVIARIVGLFKFDTDSIFERTEDGYKAVGFLGTVIEKVYIALEAITKLSFLGWMAAVIAVVAGAIGAFRDLWKNNEGFRNSVKEAWTSIKEILSNVWNGIIKPAFEGIRMGMGLIIASLGTLWKSWKSIFESIWLIIAPVVNIILHLIRILSATLIPLVGQGLKIAFVVVGGAISTAIGIITLLLEALSTVVRAIKNVVEPVFKAIADGFKRTADFLIDGLNLLIKGMNKILPKHLEIPLIVKMSAQSPGTASIKGKGGAQEFANGGFPSPGSMFIAGEAGPELLGSYRGKTTVMPLENTSFVAAIKQAVIEGISQSTGGGGDIVIKVGEYELGRATEKSLNKLSKINGGLNIAL